MLIPLINNIAFLIALAATGLIVISRSYKNPLNRQIQLGLLFGGVAVMGMANPVSFAPGVFFDGRSIVLSVVGVVGGGVPTLIAAVIASLYRYQLGGSGMVVGIMLVLLPALLGLLARRWWLRRSPLPQPIHFLTLGVVVQLVQLAAFTQIPDRAGYVFIEQAWWVLLLFYPLATMLLCLIFRNHEKQLIAQKALAAAQDAVTATERASKERFHAYFDHAIVGLAILSPQKGWIEVNDPLCAMLGYTRDELIRMTWTELTHPEDVAHDLAQFNRMLAGEIDRYTKDKRFIHKDGHLVDAHLAVSQVRKSDGSIDYVVAMMDDITEEKRVNESLRQAVSVFDHTREGIAITNAKGDIVDVNAAFTRITGYSREEVIGQNPKILSSGRQDAEFYRAMWNTLTEQGHWSGEIWNRRKNGEFYAELLTISAIRDGKGTTQQYVALFSDITAIMAHQSQLERMAHFDALTNLPNRVLLGDRLHQAMAQAQRRKQPLAVVFLDLDGFKTINDHHGHETGDQLLIALANRMKEVLREGDTLARMGDDEFVAVLTDLEDTAASEPLLNRLLAAAAQPLLVGELSFQVSASAGVTFYPQTQNIEADQLLRQADQAMYQAKVAGKNRHFVFDAEHDSSIRDFHEHLKRIRLALDRCEFVLHFQPKINMRSGKVIGAEALIRWQHPEKGLLAPATFLPLIEDHPLAIDVGEWVIDTAMHQMDLWRAAGLDLPVSVNIGARQLQQGDFVERLQAILGKYPQVHPSWIELEVLETSALNDMVQVSKVIEDCIKIGVNFALDDFGTGYSSLAYLKRLRVALIKIDQSFVRGMLTDPNDQAILQGIVGLSAAFKREVIAEGVETVAHGTALLQLGCELAQGYGISRPMPPDQLPSWVETWPLDAAWRKVMNSAEVSRSTDK